MTADVITNAYRDERSGAVIIDDDEAYAQARHRKRLAEEKYDLQNEVSTMRDELNRMHELMEQILRNQAKDNQCQHNTQ